MPLSVAPALGFSPSSKRFSYTALEVLLSLLCMAKVEGDRVNQPRRPHVAMEDNTPRISVRD
jgi:hypothetical protein